MTTSVTTVTERELTAYVRDVARALGWRRYHAWLSKHSPAGFPDEVLLRPPRLVFAELKSERAKLSDEQEAWLEELRAVPGVEVSVWAGRPTWTRSRASCGETAVERPPRAAT